MKTIYLTHPHTLNKDELEPTVMALGFFDGVHLGHQQVIKTAKETATKLGIKSAVMTFYPHPLVVLRKDKQQVEYLTSMRDKESLIEELGIDTLYVVKFDEFFADLQPQQFVDEYIIGLHVKHVVAGFDYSYGRLGKGTMETLPFHSRDQFDQTVIGKVEYEDEKISSTRLRQLVQAGKVDKVPTILSRHYAVRGVVVDGDKRGRTIGFPTANVLVEDEYLMPPLGVYAVKIKIRDKWYDGMCNIGFKPTFRDDLKKATVEVNVFDFNNDIYHEQVIVEWYTRIRSEKKFNGIHELIAQLQEDKQQIQTYFQNSQECTCFFS
ncbi:riboflavin kinase/FMN adenylyltransferase [Priestia taiwanensis]|uniref:Riboflavin biosynthesis protein n=1 Tax=Priestia taiwanensis TaxID=1347902 RepID=A0A917AP84_9BACI|nr:riboflavin kinase/FMN adenylyltransferase [Priestia taiwanensis]GGE65204.1 riboflavin biosynthesis protein [Priestia taiwanensis]